MSDVSSKQYLLRFNGFFCDELINSRIQASKIADFIQEISGIDIDVTTVDIKFNHETGDEKLEAMVFGVLPPVT